MTSSSEPTVSDRIRGADERHEIVLTIRRTTRTITSGSLEVTIRGAARRADRAMGSEQQPFGLIIDGDPVRVGEMRLSRDSDGKVADFPLNETQATVLLARIGNESRFIVQSAIASGPGPEMTIVISALDITPLRGLERSLFRLHDELEEDLRARRCAPLVATGCYLTRACCDIIGLPDDCLELRTLRRFRDEWLAHREGGPEEIATYYREAPPLAMALAADPDGVCIARDIYLGFILPSVLLLSLGLNEPARRHYRAAGAYLRGRLSLCLVGKTGSPPIGRSGHRRCAGRLLRSRVARSLSH